MKAALVSALLLSTIASAAPLDAQLRFPDPASASGPTPVSTLSYVSNLLRPVELLSAVRGKFTQRLVQTSHDSAPYWTSELGKDLLFFRGINFMDVTDHADLADGAEILRSASASSSFPSKPKYKSELKPVLANISDAGPRAHLKEFTAFKTRGYRTETGKESQKWLLKTVEGLVLNSFKGSNVSEFEHPWGQNSIIAHIPGSDKAKSKETGLVILGAHQDSTNFFPFFAAPGADDDGSGTVTLLETLRALGVAGWRPTTDVEFMWYSAEEGGLLGSQAVVADYKKRGAKVKAMLQQDMTAFLKAGTEPRAGIVDDFVSAELSDFVSLLVSNYTDLKPVKTTLGYAASDHASWFKAGYPSAFAVEAPYADCNLQSIHTTRDRYDVPEYSFEHLLEFVRLSIAFTVELSGWASKK